MRKMKSNDYLIGGIYRYLSGENPRLTRAFLDQIVASLQHWTNACIRWDEETEEWIGYNKVGLEYIRDKDYNKVRDRLVVYSALCLGE